MSTLQCANIWFESTANNRLQYSGSNGFSFVAGGADLFSVNTTAVSISGTLNYSMNTLSVSTNSANIGTALYVVANGNVSIGTGSASKKLTIDQNVASTAPSANDCAQIDIRGYQGGATNYAGIRFRMYEHTTGWGSDIIAVDDTGLYGGGISIRTNSGAANSIPVDRVRIDSSGNMGIGTTSPSTYGKLAVAGNIIPTANGSYNLGSSSYRWANIYTGDLHLSNENLEEGNSIDGTKGNWSIQEGESNLYLINNKTRKKYKFIIEEIV